MKPTLTHSSDPSPGFPLQAPDANPGTATGPEVESAAATNVLLSIPALAAGSRTTPEQSGLPPEIDEHRERISSPTIVPISVPESNRLQTLIQGGKQRFMGLAEGPKFVRIFVASGVALLFGSVGLIVWGPSSEELLSAKTTRTVSSLVPVDQNTDTGTADITSSKTDAAIQLTVSTSENNGAPERLEVDDPFTAANQVPAKVVQAVHFADPSHGQQQHAIQPVSHPGKTVAQPAWLSGTIEFEDGDNEDAGQLKRKHEHSRPSYR